MILVCKLLKKSKEFEGDLLSEARRLRPEWAIVEVGNLGRGQIVPPHQLWGVGSTVNCPSTF